MRAYLLTMLFVGISGRQECSSSENTAMQREFTECATELDHAFFQDKENIHKVTDLEAATCKLFSETIENCGKAWKRCHDGEDIRVMKDMYINHLVAQYGQNQDGVDVNRCQVVKEYRESGRQDEDYRDELCGGAKTDEMSRKFQECSHSTSSAAYQVVVDITDPTSIIDTLCKALTTIGTVCAKTLKECYNKEDLNRMKNDHLKEMKSFLLQFVEGKVKHDSLSNCPVLKNIDKPNEEEEVFEDYDRTNDINGNLPVHTATNDEHPRETIEFNIEDFEMVEEDTTQIVEHVVEVESVPEIINTSPKEELPIATTTATVAQSKMDSLKEMPANSTEEAAANSTEEAAANSTEEAAANSTEEAAANSTEEAAANSTEEAAVTQKMTSNIDNSSSLSLLERGVVILCLFFSLLSFYV